MGEHDSVPKDNAMGAFPCMEQGSPQEGRQMAFLIATHSHMASGLRNAVRMLAGQQARIYVIDAYIDCDDFEMEMNKMLREIQDQKIIVLTDLLGGSVNQAFMRYQGDKQLYLVSGVNLPLVMKLFERNEQTDPEVWLRSRVAQAREQISFENNKIKQEREAYS